MRILIYKHPWIVNGSTSISIRWASKFKEFIQSFDSNKYFFHICVGDVDRRNFIINDFKKESNCTSSIIYQKELSSIFSNYIDAHKKEKSGEYSKEEISSMMKLFQKKLGNFKPDIAFSFGGSELIALNRLFPDIPVISQEISIINARILDTPSWYLDVCGAHNNSFLSVFWQEIQQVKVKDENKKKFLSVFREKYCDVILKHNPITRRNLDPEGNFKYIVFLPLESSKHPNFFRQSNFITQFDFITYVLDRLDPGVGLVVKEHINSSKSNALSGSAIQYLRETYSNFIYLDYLKYSSMGSNFLLSLSDALITVSSTMGMQCLLWKKPFFVIGDMYIKHYSNGSKIEEIKNILEREYKDKDDVLYYLLNNYYVPHSKFLDPEWMEKFMKRAIKNHKNINFDFYEPIDTPENVLSFYTGSIKLRSWFILHTKADMVIKYLPILHKLKPFIIKKISKQNKRLKENLG